MANAKLSYGVKKATTKKTAFPPLAPAFCSAIDFSRLEEAVNRALDSTRKLRPHLRRLGKILNGSGVSAPKSDKVQLASGKKRKGIR